METLKACILPLSLLACTAAGWLYAPACNAYSYLQAVDALIESTRQQGVTEYQQIEVYPRLLPIVSLVTRQMNVLESKLSTSLQGQSELNDEQRQKLLSKSLSDAISQVYTLLIQYVMNHPEGNNDIDYPVLQQLVNSVFLAYGIEPAKSDLKTTREEITQTTSSRFFLYIQQSLRGQSPQISTDNHLLTLERFLIINFELSIAQDILTQLISLIFVNRFSLVNEIDFTQTESTVLASQAFIWLQQLFGFFDNPDRTLTNQLQEQFLNSLLTQHLTMEEASQPSQKAITNLIRFLIACFNPDFLNHSCAARPSQYPQIMALLENYQHQLQNLAGWGSTRLSSLATDSLGITITEIESRPLPVPHTAKTETEPEALPPAAADPDMTEEALESCPDKADPAPVSGEKVADGKRDCKPQDSLPAKHRVAEKRDKKRQRQKEKKEAKRQQTQLKKPGNQQEPELQPSSPADEDPATYKPSQAVPEEPSAEVSTPQASGKKNEKRQAFKDKQRAQREREKLKKQANREKKQPSASDTGNTGTDKDTGTSKKNERNKAEVPVRQFLKQRVNRIAAQPPPYQKTLLFQTQASLLWKICYR